MIVGVPFGYCTPAKNDATLALAALLCLISAMPAILPFGLRHQLVLCTVCTVSFVCVIASGVASAIAPIIPTGGWRIYTIAAHMPVFDPTTWRLRIGGLVEQPVVGLLDWVDAAAPGAAGRGTRPSMRSSSGSGSSFTSRA